MSAFISTSTGKALPKATLARAESAPAGRPDSAPLGRQQKSKNGSGERPLPLPVHVLPKKEKEFAASSATSSVPHGTSASTNNSNSTSTSRRRGERPPLQHSSHNTNGNTNTNTNTNHKTKRTSKRALLQRDPLADRCSMALGRTESILVSAAGDVLVCRCRRSSTPYISTTPQDSLNPMFLNILPCCDADCGGNLNVTSIEGPWSPVFDTLAVKRQISSGEMSQTSETSTFEWETSNKTSNKSSTHRLARTLTASTGSPNRTNRSSRSLPNLNTKTLNRTTRANGTSTNTTSGRALNITINTAPNSDAEPVTRTHTGTGTNTASHAAPLSENDGTNTSIRPLALDENAKSNASAMANEEAKEHKHGMDRSNDTTAQTTEGTTHSSFANMSSSGQLSPGILPLPSFDYSHIHEGHNDMVQSEPLLNTPANTNTRRRASQTKPFPTIMESPEEKKEEHVDDKKQPFLHGVPVFLTQLSQIRVRMVSAHPLGAHVMLISEEALLFTYGLNNHGQLGIGLRADINDETRGFHTTPTLVTPLLENGGKTINCAAGVDHSLVVVATEGRRLHKIVQSANYHNHHPDSAYSDHGALSLARVTSQPTHVECLDEDDAEADSVQHHQVYGFGCNEFMKIGLFSSAMKNQDENDDTEDVEDDILLPRRVALHCSVWPSQNDAIQSNFPPHGIFEIAASVEHSAALVRRPTGDIEVYTWGNATLGALGVPIETNSTKHSADHKKPASPASSMLANNIFPLPTVVESLTYRSHKQMSGFPRGLTLGPYSSFVLLSNGRCMSFGYSAVGMLGHGYSVTHSMTPKEVFSPNRGFVSISAGAFHVVAVTENGEAYSWGINSDDRLGLGTGEFASKVQQHNDNGNSKKSKGSSVGIEWVPQHIECSDSMSPVIRACAGYDCSMIVTRSGEVYSFGRRSGKLGKGELVADVAVPQPLYGGLRLFHNLASNRKYIRQKTKTGLQRMDSEGNLHLHGVKNLDI